MNTEIKTSAFCGLSRSEDFQKWLEVTAQDLHEDLLTVVHAARGCRANSNKMMDSKENMVVTGSTREWDKITGITMTYDGHIAFCTNYSLVGGGGDHDPPPPAREIQCRLGQ